MYTRFGYVPIWLILATMCSSGCHHPLHSGGSLPLATHRSNPPSKETEHILEQYPPLYPNDPILSPPDAAAALGPQHALVTPVIRRMALDNNPDVLSAGEELQKAKALLGQASAWPNPELDARVVMDATKTLQSEAAFRFTIPLGGRIGASRRLAAARYNLARLNLKAAQKKALLEVDRRIVQIACAKARIQLRNTLSERSAQTINIVRSGIEAAIGDPIDAALVSAGIVSDRLALQHEQVELNQLENQLRLLSGIAPHDDLHLVSGIARLSIQPDPNKLIETAMANSPVVLRQKLNLLIADYLAAQKSAERIPDLHIGPALVIEEHQTAWGVSLGMPIPLFQSGSGEYQAAISERNLAQTKLQQVSREIASQIKLLCKELHTVQSQLDQIVDGPSTELERALDMAEARYRAGKLDVLHLLAVHRAFFELKLMHLDLVSKQHALLIDLENIVGQPIRNQKDLL